MSKKEKPTKSKKEIKTKEQVASEKKNRVAQEWVGIDDIRDGVVWYADKNVLCGIEIFPISIELQTKEEQRNFLLQLSRQLETIQGTFQQLSTTKAVDIRNYIRVIEDKLTKETNPIRKKILREKLKSATEMMYSNDVAEVKYYIVTKSQGQTDKAVAITKDRIQKMQRVFMSQGIQTKIMNDDDLEGMYKNYFIKNRLKYEELIQEQQDIVSY